MSHMAMNVGHQVFLNNCWGLKCTIGKTNISSLNTPSQQLHSKVEVIQMSRCKQRNRFEKYLWSVPLRKRRRCWPNHLLPAIRCYRCSVRFVWPLACLWALIELWVYMLLESWSQATTCIKLEEFHLSFVTNFQPLCECTLSPHVFQLFHRWLYHIMAYLQAALKHSGRPSLLSDWEWGKSVNVQHKPLKYNSSGQR